MQGLGSCFPIVDYATHHFYAYAFSHNTSVCLNIKDGKVYLLPPTNATSTIYAWGSGSNDGTGSHHSLADVSDTFDCDDHNSYVVAGDSNHIYDANNDS